MVWGTDEQKDRFLGPILSGEEIWCQGFSEPDAGSDLAALKTRAVPDGDGWRVTGQKVWTSGAQHAKWCMLVARTDTEAARHKGLTYFLMDMEQDAVQVRPLRQITGESEFNELFIEDAFIAGDCVVGGVGNGWKVALTTLMNERAGLAFFLQVLLRRSLDDLIDAAAARGLLDDDVVADRLGALHVKTEILRLTAYRGLTAIERYGQPGPGGLADQVDVVGHQPGARAARGRHPRPGGAHAGLALGLRAPARPRELDRGRHDGDPQEHRRRARARPAAGGAGMNFGFSEDQQTIKATARELLADRSPLGPRPRGGGGRRARRAALARAVRARLAGHRRPRGARRPGARRGGARRAARGARLRAGRHALPRHRAGRRGDRPRRRRRAARALAAGPGRGELAGAFGGPALAVGAPGADVLVIAGADGGARVLAAADAEVEPIATVDPTRRYGRVAGEGEPLPGDVAGALDRGAAAIAAELVGVCQRALDMTVAYVSERRQFGVPVGAFQAVSHRCAQMLLHTEGARSAAYFAAWAADAAPERLAEAAGLARVAGADAAKEVTGSAIQAHGGIGFTWEADVHWLFKRAQLDAALLGGGSRARIALARLVAGRR